MKEQETINLAPGELRDIDDNYICTFSGGVMFRDDEDECDIGYLELIQTEGAPSLLSAETGLHKFVINGVVCAINIGDIDFTEGCINAYYTSTGFDVNLDKYRPVENADESEDEEVDDGGVIHVQVHVPKRVKSGEVEPCSYTLPNCHQLWFINHEQLHQYLKESDREDIKESLEGCDSYFTEVLDEKFEEIYFEVLDSMVKKDPGQTVADIVLLPDEEK